MLLISLYLFVGTYLVASAHAVESNEEFCTIETESGRVRGKQNRTLYEKTTFYSFRGIPFAKPPVGNLRFKAPQKIDRWNGTLDALEFGNDCLQAPFRSETYFGSEDCLNLNVYVPADSCLKINSGTKLTTIIYIYGGRFMFGTSNFYGPDFLMETDVILVVFNHRVGPFGFLNLNMPEYSGNMAMKDEVLAIQWVHENIEHFGGDKNKIVLAGHSTGAITANLHMVRPETKHLFQRAILLHGSAISPFLPARNDHTDIIRDFAENMSYPVVNQSDLLQFINEVDPMLLCRKFAQPPIFVRDGTMVASRIWTASIERSDAVDPFLTEYPYDMLMSDTYQSSIDTLHSCAENVIFAKFIPWPFQEVNSIDEQVYPELITAFDEIFEIDLPFERIRLDFASETYRNISKRIREFYFDGKHATLGGMNDLIADITFLYGIDLSARIQSKKSTGRVFFSRFTAENDWNFSVFLYKAGNCTMQIGSHADVLAYLFRFGEQPAESYLNLEENSLPRRLIKNITSFYSNFAKFGNPMPNLEPSEYKTTESNQGHYYEISNDAILIKENSKRDRIEIWDGILNDYKHHWNISFDFP